MSQTMTTQLAAVVRETAACTAHNCQATVVAWLPSILYTTAWPFQNDYTPHQSTVVVLHCTAMHASYDNNVQQPACLLPHFKLDAGM